MKRALPNSVKKSTVFSIIGLGVFALVIFYPANFDFDNFVRSELASGNGDGKYYYYYYYGEEGNQNSTQNLEQKGYKLK